MDQIILEKKLYQKLAQKNYRITTVESCTGGMLASLVVDIPGISQFFHQGYVTYSDEAKQKMIHVPEEIIRQYGVVSVETAEAMACGAARQAEAECAIATTGVAGPSGGTPDTPVGCVCFGCFVDGKVYSMRRIFQGDRKEIRRAAALEAFRFLLDCLERE